MSSMNFEEYFIRGLKADDYEKLLEDKKRLHDMHYKKFNPGESDVKEIEGLRTVNILVITEPWCGDSLAIYPVIKKMSEINGRWNIRIVLRDENIELIDKFLTKGGRAIPKILFLNSDYKLITDWGPRPLEAMKIFDKNRKDISDGKIKKSEVILRIRRFYASDRGRSIFREIIKLIKKIK